jgi:hypothetical protein
MKTAWGRLHQARFALMNGDDVLASAVEYDLAGRLDDRPLRIYGIGSVFAVPADRGPEHHGQLLEKMLDRAALRGADLALLFTPSDFKNGALNGCEAIPLVDVTFRVEQSSRHGAPMTMVRGGEARDLPAIAAMGRVRAQPFRFHLDRDVDFLQYAITKKRLLAGLGSPHARQLHFFIAEEGTTAAAYVVLSGIGDTWILEECGDRDASGARVGALLQALIAREPAERRPAIRGWLPPGFLPPQVTVAATTSAKSMMVIALTRRAQIPTLCADDVLYWHNDVF